MAEPRLYLSYGITRSGSTLAFRLLSHLLELCGQPQRHLGPPLVPDWTHFNFSDEIGPAHWQALAPGETLAIKTHAAPPAGLAAALAEGRALAHAVVRDPRDIALSLIEAGRRAQAQGGAFADILTLDRALAELENQTRILEAWLALPGVELLRYQDLAGDPAAVLRRLAWQLGLAPSQEQLAEAARRGSRRTEPEGAGHARLMSLADQTRVLAALPRLAALSAAPPPSLARPGLWRHLRRRLRPRQRGGGSAASI